MIQLPQNQTKEKEGKGKNNKFEDQKVQLLIGCSKENLWKSQIKKLKRMKMIQLPQD